MNHFPLFRWKHPQGRLDSGSLVVIDLLRACGFEKRARDGHVHLSRASALPLDRSPALVANGRPEIVATRTDPIGTAAHPGEFDEGLMNDIFRR